MHDSKPSIASGSIHALRQSVASDQFCRAEFLGMDLLFLVYDYRVLLVKRFTLTVVNLGSSFEACEQE